MAEPAKKAPAKKAPARKASAKRGPTKAAALKALGITKEDLETLDKVKEDSAVQALLNQSSLIDEADIVSRLIEDEKPDSIDISDAVHRLIQDEKSDVPDAVVEYPVGEYDPNATIDVDPDGDVNVIHHTIPSAWARPTSTALYARNMMYSPFRFKTESDKQYSLAPRGFRGDFKVIHKDDLEDSNILDNANRGLIEILTREQADQVITKQHTNATSTDHLKSFLRNPEGKEYADDAFKIASEEETQGITVASTQELDKLQQNGKGIINWGEVHNPTDPVKSDDPYAGMSENERLDALDKATRQGGNPLAGLRVSIGN